MANPNTNMMGSRADMISSKFDEVRHHASARSAEAAHVCRPAASQLRLSMTVAQATCMRYGCIATRSLFPCLVPLPRVPRSFPRCAPLTHAGRAEFHLA